MAGCMTSRDPWSGRPMARLRPKRQHSLIEGMPAEIIYHIASYIELHDRYQLSLTCPGFFGILGEDWDQVISSLGYRESIDFWTGIAYHKPDHFLCGCGHHLSLYHPSSCEPSAMCHWGKTPAVTWQYTKFTLHHADIEVALKYSRLRLYERLARVMKPHVEVSSSAKVPTWRFEARRKIIQSRYLLHLEWKFAVPFNTRTEYPAMPPPVEGQNQASYRRWLCIICNHLTIMLYPKAHSSRHGLAVHDREDGVILNRDEHLVGPKVRKWTVHMSCAKCPMDFEIAVVGKRVRYSTWHDFGGYASYFDPIWMSHMPSPPGPPVVVSHEPGSVREMYHGMM